MGALTPAEVALETGDTDLAGLLCAPVPGALQQVWENADG
jgi:hypothetical protein